MKDKFSWKFIGIVFIATVLVISTVAGVIYLSSRDKTTGSSASSTNKVVESVAATNKAASGETIERTNSDGYILVKEEFVKSNGKEVRCRYYKDPDTNLMYISLGDASVVKLEDPETGRHLTYKKFLRFFEEVSTVGSDEN